MGRRIALFGGVGVIAVAAIAFGAWYYLIRSDAPDAVDIDDASAAAGTSTAAASSSATARAGTSAAGTSTPASGGTAGSAAGGLAGTWRVIEGSQSFVGYRVQEELANVGSATAVGRTSGVTGTIEFDGSTITAVDLEADLTRLASDREQRDGQLRRQALETTTYPTATFTLTEPIALDGTPQAGVTISKTAVGDLTLHGVTKAVEIPIQGQLVNGQVVVIGSTEIQFADYKIAQPTSFSVLSVEDHGTLEFQLYFGR